MGSVSGDGKVIYAAFNETALNGHILGWDYSGALVYDSGFIPGGPDGIGVIQGSNPFAGNLVANFLNGTVWLLDPVAHTSVEIASGGSRGDYVGIDGNDGSLFLTQTDSVYRLTCVPPCVFQPPPAAVPEPGSLALLTASLLGGAIIDVFAAVRVSFSLDEIPSSDRKSRFLAPSLQIVGLVVDGWIRASSALPQGHRYGLMCARK